MAGPRRSRPGSIRAVLLLASLVGLVVLAALLPHGIESLQAVTSFVKQPPVSVLLLLAAGIGFHRGSRK